jgi:23S rRNA (adenine2503-C2)-methyltransferase
MEENKISNEEKRQLKGLTIKELKNFFFSIGEPSFRGEQVFNWMYNHLVTSFDDMGNIPKVLRQKLHEKSIMMTLELVEVKQSANSGTKKFLFKTREDMLIESVLIPDDDRITLCVSSQIGCPLDCKFCATGVMGFKKNLTSGEIFDQYLLAQKNSEQAITNIVYMGMGEPLLNFKEVLRSIRIFAAEKNTNISLSKITVSTVGIPQKIKYLADSGLKVKLAFSLHSCFEDIRSSLIPLNKKYSLGTNLNFLDYYYKKTNRRITFEYIMLKDINDRDEDIAQLVKLSRQIPSKINVIPFNSIKHMNPEGLSAELEPTSLYVIDKFVTALRENNVSVFVRDTQGDDISAACGQLAFEGNLSSPSVDYAEEF